MGMGQFAYANNNNRFLAASELVAQPFAVVGVPFDGAVTNRPGARFGPQEIRRASLMLAEVRRHIQAQAASKMTNHHCVFLGGDHSVTLPLLRAARAQHGELALVHFDAHCDTWQDHFDEPSGQPWYLTLDIGCLDPAFAPGTGTPEPGGMTSSQVLTFLEELAPLNMIGMDCVEVAPAYDHAELTSTAAATLVWTYLCRQVAKRS